MSGPSSVRSPDSPRLRTASLNRRVLLLALGVLLATLVVVGVVADVLLGAQLRADASTRLNARADAAQAALNGGAQPREVVAAARGDGITASLLTTAGTVVGNTDVTPTAPTPPGPTPPAAGKPGPPANLQQLTRQLSDGSQLTVAVDTAAIDDVRAQLRTVLIPTLGAAFLAAAALLWLGTRTALRPVDRMTTLAQSITRGQRGRRLSPTRPDTELGRTAVAFDEMLDALEGAEAAARDAAAQTRRFTDDAAHELRTPLAGLQAASEALLGIGSRLDSDRRDQIQLLLVREARRAGHLVDELLSLANLDAGVEPQREPVELSALVRNVVEQSRLIAPDVAIDLRTEPITILGDESRLTQLVSNLLDNARRHGGRPGRVLVELKPEARHDPEMVEISVTDNGPGIAAADRERVFDRLVRLDKARSRSAASDANDGSGLGLSIARGLARAGGGDLVCTDPAPGWTGASFVASLTRSDRDHFLK